MIKTGQSTLGARLRAFGTVLSIEAVGPIDKHRDQPLHGTAQLKHAFQHVAAGVVEIDYYDVRLQ